MTRSRSPRTPGAARRPRRVSVLFTTPNFVTAGSGRALANIATRLDRDRFEPRVAVLKPGGALFAELPSRGVPVDVADFVRPVRPYPTLPARAWAASRSLRRLGPIEIVHSWHYGDDYSEPIVARFAGARAWVCTKKNMNWNGRAWKVRCALASRIVAQNQEMLDRFFATRRFAARTVLIPRGVDADRFRPDPATRARVRRILEIDETAVVVVCVAQMVPLKQHRLIIDAVARMDARPILLFAGGPLDTDYARGLAAAAAEAGISPRTRFLGHVDDVASLLSVADVSVLVSRSEGSPVALLEAMAAGLPVVASRIPGPAETIEHGRSGFLVPSDKVEALADVLDRLAADPQLRNAVGEAARQRVLDRFTIDREVADHERLYESLVRPG